MQIETAVQRSRQFRRHEHLAHGTEPQNNIFRIEEGWASRYCVIPDGRRQITSLFLPGDYCEPHWLLSGSADLPIVALTPVRAQLIPLAGIHARAGDGVMNLLGAVMTTYRRQTHWLVSLGRKSALERVTELLVELYTRLRDAGRVAGNRCTVPLTQQDIADIVGLTPVHVNRVLAELRRRDLANFIGKTLHLPDPRALGVAPAHAPEPGDRPAAERMYEAEAACA